MTRHWTYFVIIGFLSFFGCNQQTPNASKDLEMANIPINQPIDSILKSELEQISIEDQTLRLILPDISKKFGNGSDEEKYIWSIIHRQDSISQNKVTEILEKYGWVGRSKVGDKANQALWLVIQHAELVTQEKYIPLLKNSVAIGESEGWHLAFLEDRILMRNKKNQIYGTQANWDKTTGKMKIYPIDDVENVNKIREALGLERIEEYAKMNGYIFDQNDKQKL